MKIKHLFLALLALPLFFAACEPDQKEPTPAPSLKLTSEATLSFEADGGEGSLSYELKNAVEGTTLEATADVEWITVGEVEAAKVNFTVEANEGEARSGKVTATYGDLSIFVTVNQDAKGGNDDPQLEVSTWTVVGTINDWDVANGLQMFVTEDGYHAALGVELTAEDKVKFVNNGSWDENRGGNNEYVVEANYYIAASHNGQDVAFAAAGKYDLYLNAELDKIYVMAEGKLPAEAQELKKEEPEVTTWDVMGDFQDNNWTTPYELVKGDQYYVAQDVVFANANNEGLAFKIRKNASWDTSYGTADGATYELGTEIALDGTSNIFVNGTVGEKYDIYFDEANMKVWVMQDGLKPGEKPVEPNEPLDITFTEAVVSKNSVSAGYMQLTFTDDVNTLVVEFLTETETIEDGLYIINNSYSAGTIYAPTSKLNDKTLDAGEVNVSHDGTQYYVTFSDCSADGGAQPFSGLYIGSIAFEDGSLMGAPKNEVIKVASIDVGYRSDDGSEMELIIYEDHENKYMHVIDFLPSTPNPKYIEAGTYSTADGTLSSQYSKYRYNSSTDTALMTDAVATLTHDIDAGTTTIVVNFTTENGQSGSIEWTGKIGGFDFSVNDGSINVTEWGNVNIKTWAGYNNDREYMFSAYSADNSLEINLDCYVYPNNSDKVWPEGTYNVEAWKMESDYIAAGGNYLYCTDSSFGYLNGIKFTVKSGTIDVQHVDGEYDVTFDIITSTGENIKGHYVGGAGEYGSAALP